MCFILNVFKLTGLNEVNDVIRDMTKSLEVANDNRLALSESKPITQNSQTQDKNEIPMTNIEQKQKSDQQLLLVAALMGNQAARIQKNRKKNLSLNPQMLANSNISPVFMEDNLSNNNFNIVDRFRGNKSKTEVSSIRTEDTQGAALVAFRPPSSNQNNQSSYSNNFNHNKSSKLNKRNNGATKASKCMLFNFFFFNLFLNEKHEF